MRRLSLDTETTGIYLRHGCQPFYVSTAYESQGRVRVRSWEWEVDPLTREPIVPPEEIDELRNWLDEFDRFDCWNAKFERLALRTLGIDFDLKKTDDWFVASHLLNSEGPHDLKSNAFYHLNILDDDQLALKTACVKARGIASRLKWAVASPDHPHFRPLVRAPKAGWWVCEMFLPRAVAQHQKLPASHPWHSVLSHYADQDAVRHLAIGQCFKKRLEDRKLYELYERRLAVQELTARMEDQPIHVRLDAAESRIEELKTAGKQFARNACRISGIENAGSTKQIANYLFSEHRIDPPFLTTNGAPSTSKDSLEKIIENANEKTPKEVVEFSKELIKSRIHAKGADYLRQYLQALLPEGLYQSINICGTATTRFSSQYPNTQNISAGKSDKFLEEWMPEVKKPNLRMAFGPRRGRFWLACDFQKQQLVGFAHCAGDKQMIERMKNGEDPHLITSRRIFGLRPDQEPDKGQKTIGKNCNFGFAFGAAEAKINRTAKMEGLYTLLRELMPEAIRYMERIKAIVAKTHLVHTPGGYPLVCRKPHKGVNYIVQGHEGEVVQLAMLLCDAYLQERSSQFTHRGVEPAYIALQVHDEIIFDMPDIPYSYALIPGIKQRMVEASVFFGIPGSVDAEIVRESWDKAEKYRPAEKTLVV